MSKLKGGAIISSNLVAASGDDQSLAGMFSTTQLYLGQITDVIYVDDQRNRSTRFVEYDILINDGTTHAKYRNVRALDSFGDENNFQENTYSPVTDGKRGKKDDTEAFHFKNGAMVLVAFINGHKENAVIIGGLQHPNTRLESPTNEVSEFNGSGSSTSRDAAMIELPTIQPGAVTADDKRVLGEFQGLRWNINKDGELTVIFQGPKDDKGQLSTSEAQPTIMKFNKDGEWMVIDNLDQEIKISRVDGKILISDGNADPDFIEIDRNNKNITIKATNDEIEDIGNDHTATIGNDESIDVENDASLSVGGNRDLSVDGSLKETVKGDQLNTVAGKRRETIGGQWRVVAGAGVTIVGGTDIRLIAPSISLINQDETVIGSGNVKLGGTGATHRVLLGELFQTLYNDLVTKFNTHTHGGAVSAPTLQGTPSTDAELSDTVRVDKTFSGNPDSSDT